ncbi:hypothetical protein Q765_04150 [Flavobacterium rivuli WB 3.3-2 = DSM 21788]|uniref:Uncharacterized protein n=1 Tax=Flavobacterium rivuli WB 3.3-2 = DSM 21788 TaxID=1121895 RepID=A0A0A2M9Y3_9FLAO|nr:hypothetical protein [Flavobacterium rivuli]KGO88233.1 hypothetical protein Q765_04150 [Flavobacterium rivuli WB 3.3-2 = DSM 21788]
MELSDLKKKYFYSLGIAAYNSIEPSEIEDIDKSLLMLQQKYISYVVDHKLLPVPLTEVCHDLIIEDKIIGYYKIYLDPTNIIIEEILFLY